MDKPALRDLLERHAAAVNVPEFVKDDPVQFPRSFDDKRDIEIAALLVSTISWGRRPMILNDARKLLDIMDNEPYRFVMKGDIEGVGDMNIHRTFFGRNLRHYLRGLRAVYRKHTTLEDAVRANGASDAWDVAAILNRALCDANGGCGDSRCLPLSLDTAALKRLNMALRWLVRDDGIVDMGVWTVLKPARLYIPLDVHVGNVSRQLGLLDRKANDRKSVMMLTAALASMRPHDPVYYDYALFGIGVNGLDAGTGIFGGTPGAPGKGQ